MEATAARKWSARLGKLSLDRKQTILNNPNMVSASGSVHIPGNWPFLAKIGKCALNGRFVRWVAAYRLISIFLVVF